MKLIKTSLFSAIITFVRLGSGFFAAKFVAYFTGPSGIALVGQFSNFISIILTFSNGAINNGVIKYTAEYKADEARLGALLSTAVRISIFCSSIVGLTLIFFSQSISGLIFQDHKFTTLIGVFGATILFYALNTLLVSFLNGRGEIKQLTLVNTIGVILGLILTVVLVSVYNIHGALYSLILSQSLVFFYTMYYVGGQTWFKLKIFLQPFSTIMARKLAGFSLMAIASVLTVPVSQLLLRNFIITLEGVNSAGIWQGLMKISDGYLMLVITSLSTYYLPKLSSLKNDTELRDEIFRGARIILPFVIFCCVGIYLTRNILIELLYTKDFLEMENLFLFQLLGDFFKIASWLLGYLMVAKAMTSAFIFSEIFFNITYVIMGYICLDRYGLIGISYAFFLNYLLAFLSFTVYFRKIISAKNNV